jgi:F0F1-type ATP synthase assembly protein I
VVRKKGGQYKKNRVWAESIHITMQIGLTMAGCIVFCFFIGRLIDDWLGFKGIFTVIFILFGIAGGANVVYRQIMEVTEADKKNEEKDGTP